ncbi:MAG: helix-hairpin-helix domain-containing protein [Candidatus Pacebacteria bacterium]|nr:helix-hairpin-helix domain-containing protein [Candidatus Paceibacterota bacterium]
MNLPLHKTMTNQQIAEVMEFISEVISLDKKNIFRVKAYQEAAETIAQWNEQLIDIYKEHTKEEAAKIYDNIPGIGESITKKLIELFSTGDIKAFQKYVVDLPDGMFSLCQVNGIGAKRAYKLCQKFPMKEANALERVMELASQGKIRDLEGFGEKSEQDLILAIRDHQTTGRMPYDIAKKLADQVVEKLNECKSITKVEVLGSLRRHHTSIGDVDLGIATDDIKDTSQCIKKLDIAKRVVVSGEGLIRIILNSGQQVDIKISAEDEWGSFLQHFTGSKEHNIMLRRYALKKGLSLSEHGILNKKTGEMKKYKTESAFYKALGMKLVPPNERMGGDEIERYQL